jgi:hypothetical protein
MMKSILPLLLVFCMACKEAPKKEMTVQEIVDKSIAASGGLNYLDHNTSFVFRNKTYSSEHVDSKKVLKRIFFLDSVKIVDVKSNSDFQRFINDSLVHLPDSISNRYANSMNSVHYFARLPHGLNDPAVNKTLLGIESIGGREYFKVKVTFDETGGGDDFDDTYVYWFDKETYKPDYLAYDFHVNGGGQRFRKAYNERFVNGIRFVDYENYKAKDGDGDILEIARKFEEGQLELLSKIELEQVEVVKN